VIPLIAAIPFINLWLRSATLSLLLLTAYPTVWARQSTSKTIQGLVLDASNKTPLANAMVFLKIHDHVGAITNEDGSFSLTVPAYALNDDFIVSALGYTSKTAPVQSLSAEISTTILLQPQPILLQDIVIEGEGYNLKEICKLAMKSLAKNSPNKRHYLEGFYRKVSTDSLEYTGLIEAKVAIKDTGYKLGTENTQIEVLEARYGDNVIEWDSVAIKVYSSMQSGFNKSAFNSLHRFYESNYVRLFNNSYTVFNQEGGLFDFDDDRNGIVRNVRLRDVSHIDGDTILNISYESYDQAGQALDKISLSINISDYAVVEFTRGFVLEWVNVKFRKEDDGRYYPYFIKRVSPALIDRGGRRRYSTIETFETDFTERPGQTGSMKPNSNMILPFGRST
jgi:hypothetical protein